MLTFKKGPGILGLLEHMILKSEIKISPHLRENYEYKILKIRRIFRRK